MRRFQAYDPPEYMHWAPDPEIVAEYHRTLEADPERRAIIAGLDRKRLLGLYRGLLRNRLHDIQLKRWVMQGVTPKAWLGVGEEAVTIGCVHALGPGDVVGPMIRNAGACHEKGIPLADMFKVYLGTGDTPLRGRDLHLGDLRYDVIAPTSMVASLVPVMAGVALALRREDRGRIALTWVGDGSVRTGEFHEGASLAAAARVPLVIVLQNNQVALGTPFATHSRVPLTELARAYGGPCLTAAGNNVLDVFAAATILARACREGGGPAFLIAETGRMGGHATHDEGDGRRILPPEHFAHWGKRDPVGCYETYLVAALGGSGEEEAAAVRAELAAIEEAVTAEMDAAAAAALASKTAAPPDPAGVEIGVVAPLRNP
jgi:2-oxoisovalerate dehydrogenase E1 component